MKPGRFSHVERLAFATLLLLGSRIQAQKAPAPGLPNPLAPVLDMPNPLGTQPGASLDLTLTGSNLAGPVDLWTSFPATVNIPTDQSNGKEETKLRVHLQVSKEAQLGFQWIRLATTRGISNARLFCIDDLPSVAGADSNRARTTAQLLEPPCVVSGKAAVEASSWYRIHAQAGQRLTFEVLGHRLGSAFDPRLALYDAMGHELAFDDDAPGCQSDSRLTYLFRAAGDYLVEVRDTTWRGGPDFWFRLRVGDFPCAVTPIPLAARRGTTATVHFAGPNVDGVAPVQVTAPSDPLIETVWVTPRGVNGQSGWPVALAISDLEELVEQEPNDQPARANRLPMPCGVSGRFHKKGDVDFYAFPAKKGQRLLIEGHTLELGSPTLLYCVLRDAKGTEVGRSNPQAAPPLDQRIDFTPSADGDYTLEVQNLLGAGGPSESYRITVMPYRPGFNLVVNLDRFDVPPGSATAVPIQVTRRDYSGPIEITAHASRPGISGHLTIPAGQPAAPNQPPFLLLLVADTDSAPRACTLWFEGTGTADGKPISERGNVRAVVSQNLGGLAFPPRPLDAQLGAAVTAKPPFTLAVRAAQPEGVRNVAIPLTVSVQRGMGAGDEIIISAVSLPANVTAALKNVPKGQGEVVVQLTAATNVPLGKFEVALAGKTKVRGKEVQITAPPIAVALVQPFELEVMPITLEPDHKGILKVKAKRLGGYQGPIALELRNLPGGVTAAKATIADGKSETEVEVTAAASASVGEKADVNVLGTATAAGNQQVPSANFKVSVLKK